MPCHILFVGSRDTSLSAMAAACARPLAGKAHTISFAAVGSGEPHPVARALLAEGAPDAAALKPLALANLRTPVDLAIAMDSAAEQECPPLPGNPCFLNWNLWEPAASGPEAGIKDNFRSVRDAIRRLVGDLFERGYLAALSQCRNRFEIVFDNISDGIIGHDLNRTITHFNRAAENITGYSRQEVINRDCHSVFPGNFCGGKCKFCDGSPAAAAKEDDEELTLTTKTGESRRIHMTRRFMSDSDGKRVGVLASFRDLTRERDLERKAGKAWNFSGIIGRDRNMLEVFDLIKELADSSVPVLIEGESGTGKELVAAAIHNEGPRAGKLFVPVNCGALPESLLESELFGHVKGAFTGAIRDKKGRFELADGGTIFLDEIGDISPAMQVKLLRVLQEGSFERVGGEQTIRVDVRVISATNKNISQEIAENRFRQDLFYRLSVVPLTLPPLRERRNDIPLLVDHILKGIIEDRGRPVTVSPEAMDLLMSHSWPGNVRELQNWLQFAMIKCRGDTILPQHLPPPRPTHATVQPPSFAARHLDMESVRSALEKTGGNKVEAARVLGVSRATLYRFLDANEPGAPGEAK